jgi:hypothetical protein
MSNTAFAGLRLRFFSAHQVIKHCYTVSVLYGPNFRLPSNTVLNFYSSYVATRYYSTPTTTEMKLLCVSLIQFFYVTVSIHGQRTETHNQPDATMPKNFSNAYNLIKNRLYHVLCPIFPASFYYEKK